MCGNDFIVNAMHEHTATASGTGRTKVLLAYAKVAANTAKIKTVALWQSGMKGRLVVLGSAALLVSCGVLCFCTNGNEPDGSRLKYSQELPPSTSQPAKEDGSIVYDDGATLAMRNRILSGGRELCNISAAVTHPA